MRNILILHGYAGNGPLHWQTWLAYQLQQRNEKVFYPELPNPHSPARDEWVSFLKETLPPLNSESILVCHSLGCATAFQLLQDPSVNAIDKLILVAPTNPGGLIKTGLTLLQPFYDGINFQIIREKTKKIEIFKSDNDPHVSEEELLHWEKELKSKSFLFPSGAHLNVAAGFTEFREVLESILSP